MKSARLDKRGGTRNPDFSNENKQKIKFANVKFPVFYKMEMDHFAMGFDTFALLGFLKLAGFGTGKLTKHGILRCPYLSVWISFL